VSAPAAVAHPAAHVEERVELDGDWLLWRDFAVRSAGFPVSGLHAFGPGEESARLREVARDAAFGEAMTWQNPAAVANALDKVASGDPETTTSKSRRREDVVASYWQRYCAKNDTIGFYGPLAWGRISSGDPALSSRSGALIRERSVHLESWGVQTLAAALDPSLRVALGPRSEDDLRALLLDHPDPELRARGLSALASLEAARDAVASADRRSLPAALANLDAEFVRLTGVEPTRNHGRAYGARTLAYVDCLRDLDVTIGPEFLASVAPALTAVFEAGRWYCGRIQAIGETVIQAALPAAGERMPFGAIIGRVLGPLMQLPPAIDAEVAELQRRMRVLLAEPDPATLAARAHAIFADHRPAWRFGCYQSVDVQVAAPDEQAVRDGDYLAVIGDVHPGSNPLLQGFFGNRHPAPERMYELLRHEAGEALASLLPPWGRGMQVDARGVPLFGDDAVHISINPESSAPLGQRTWRADELWVEGRDVVDASGELRVPLVDVFAMPIFVAAVRTFELFAGEAHAQRLTVGRVVLRRESWAAAATDVPRSPDAFAQWAREQGMPRRVFVKTPVERKPFYLDLESATLRRIALRHILAAAAEAEPIRFSEMLPDPEQCWLADTSGHHYASELRLIGVHAAPAER
jgi:hypothetical protein